MMVQHPDTFVLSLGGSVFAPTGELRGINIEYIKKFEKFIREQVAAGRRFFIVTGGGYTARLYRDAAAEVVGKDKVEDEDLDWLGVHATRINAHLFRTIFKDITPYKFLKHYDVVDKTVAEYPVVICSGWKPGWSTDYDAVLVANDYGIKTVINMSNIDKVYDSDPKTNPNAKAIEKMGWDELIDIVGGEWRPGMNAPFDPIASKLAKKIGLKVVVCNGNDLDNVEKILKGEAYEGTTIE